MTMLEGFLDLIPTHKKLISWTRVPRTPRYGIHGSPEDLLVTRGSIGVVPPEEFIYVWCLGTPGTFGLLCF